MTALDRGIIVSRQYHLTAPITPTLTAPTAEGNQAGTPPAAGQVQVGPLISQAKVDDVIQVKLTLIAPHDLHYVVDEDPIPAGTEGIDTSLATTSVTTQGPELTRTDRLNPWRGGYGRWFFSRTELRDDRAVLFATYLPQGTYEFTYSLRATLPGQYRVRPAHAEEMYFPEVFGRSDAGVFTVTE